jgi:hypothetical protein
MLNLESTFSMYITAAFEDLLPPNPPSAQGYGRCGGASLVELRQSQPRSTYKSAARETRIDQ